MEEMAARVEVVGGDFSRDRSDMEIHFRWWYFCQKVVRISNGDDGSVMVIGESMPERFTTMKERQIVKKKIIIEK